MQEERGKEGYQKELRQFVDFLRDEPCATQAEVYHAGFGHLLETIFGNEIEKAYESVEEAGKVPKFKNRTQIINLKTKRESKRENRVREEVKEKILEVFRKNPDADIRDILSVDDMRCIGYFGRLFEGDLNQVRKEAGVFWKSSIGKKVKAFQEWLREHPDIERVPRAHRPILRDYFHGDIEEAARATGVLKERRKSIQQKKEEALVNILRSLIKY